MYDEPIDVLMTTYNGEKYLKEQLDSILKQTYKNIRLIISDDCSEDSTIEILKQYENISNVEIYYQKENLGYTKNFEFLIEKVDASIYMLSDQDDVWHEDKIEKTLKYMKNQNADLVFTDLEVVDKNLKTINKSFNRNMNKIHKIRKTLKKNSFEYLYNNITGCTIMTKKEFIKKILPFPKDSKYIIHDSWIGLITSFNGKIAYLDEPTIKYRQHGDNQIGVNRKSYSAKSLDEIRNLFIEVKKDLFKTYIENEDKFPEDLKELNHVGQNYFDMIEKKNKINFKKWSVFHKLYKYETFSYYILNFLILNMPAVARFLFKLRGERNE